MLSLYRFLTDVSQPAFLALLERRAKDGKEIRSRLPERMGQPSRPHPGGPLVWVHAASVGEAQSMLILIDELLRMNSRLHILVTTGTTTSANMMGQKLPARTFHQFYPLDHPEWVQNFLGYWQPDLVFWMESELWPNMLSEIRSRGIPAVLLNARMSEKSFQRWKMIRNTAAYILNCFSLILTQTQRDSELFAALGAKHVHATDNLKFSAKPLPSSEQDLGVLQAHTAQRPVWLYASSHAGEEELACRVHQVLRGALPDLLTVITPRHPDRRAGIRAACEAQGLKAVLRGDNKTPPEADTDIYIADTMGELGLFYRLAPAACIGRSFSEDGGGGHNPIEAAQLNCAVIHGPHVQNFEDIFREMGAAGAALRAENEQQLTDTLRRLLTDEKFLHEYQRAASVFSENKAGVIRRVMSAVSPLLRQSGISSFQETTGTG